MNIPDSLLLKHLRSLDDEERNKVSKLVNHLERKAELIAVLQDVGSGALPVSECPGFMLWMAKRWIKFILS